MKEPLRPNKLALAVFMTLMKRTFSHHEKTVLNENPASFFSRSQAPVNRLFSYLIFGRDLSIYRAKSRPFKYENYASAETALSDNQREFTRQFTNMLSDKGVSYFRGGDDNPDQIRLNFSGADQADMISVLGKAGRESDAEIFFRFDKGAYVPIVEIEDYFVAGSKVDLDIMVVEKVFDQAKSPIFYYSLIQIDFWEEFKNYSSGKMVASRRQHSQFSRIAPKTFDRIRNLKDDAPEDSVSRMYNVNFPIDVVYTWVDDQDEEWQKSKEAYRDTKGKAKGDGRSLNKERFRNRDELLYSLRSIELFAPFVRNIYIVTADQVPSWLNTEAGNLKVVSHSEIYRNKSHLPTFNSSGIETQLHHIEGLSEHFLYFNDDFFLGAMCTPEDFFHANGALKFFPSEQRVNETDVDETREEYIVADKNAIELLKRDFEIAPRLIMRHCPYASSKTLLNELEARYQAEFDACASNRFRSTADLRPIAFMQYHYGFKQRMAFPDSLSHRYLALWKPEIAAQFNGVQKTRRYKTFCINDVGVTEDREETVNRLVEEFLESYFPGKSRFEK